VKVAVSINEMSSEISVRTIEAHDRVPRPDEGAVYRRIASFGPTEARYDFRETFTATVITSYGNIFDQVASTEYAIRSVPGQQLAVEIIKRTPAPIKARVR
jgi:hypothetical protein